MVEPGTAELIGIGVLADQLGVAPSTVRLWERQGLIPAAPRIAGQHRRVYRAGDVDAIRRVLEERETGRRKAVAA